MLKKLIIRTRWEGYYPYSLYTFFYASGRRAFKYETPYTITATYINENDELYKDCLQCIRSGKENAPYNITIQKFNNKGKKIKEYKTY